MPLSFVTGTRSFQYSLRAFKSQADLGVIAISKCGGGGSHDAAYREREGDEHVKIL